MEVAFIDTCVLLKSYVCDTLLSIGEMRVYKPIWSTDILEELRRNLFKLGIRQEAIDYKLRQMAASFPDACVIGYENLIPAMTNHPKDRHVLAAAIYGKADVVVTENVRDFATAEGPDSHHIQFLTQDQFLLDQLDAHPEPVLTALHRQTSRYRREPRTVEALLKILSGPGNGCPGFAYECEYLLQPHWQASRPS